LGLLAPTTLLSGSVLDDGFSSGIFQLSGGVTTVAAALQAIVGPLVAAKLDFIGIPNHFTADFTQPTASESPDIFLVSAIPIPEPASGLLFAMGCAAILAFGWRRRARPRAFGP
jgi:hypothetical protein